MLLSTRDTAGWWKSANNTILNDPASGTLPDDRPCWAQVKMIDALFGQRFTPN